MSSLIDAIVDDITAMGVTIVTNTPVSNIVVHAAEPSFYDRINPVTGIVCVCACLCLPFIYNAYLQYPLCTTYVHVPTTNRFPTHGCL